MKNTRRIIAAIILAVLMLTLCACGNSSQSDAVGSPAAQGDSSQQAGYVFNYNGIAVTVKADASPIIDALGEPASYFEAESCAFDGLDKTYTYPEFVIVTYPDGDTDRISTVRFTTDTVSTTEGVCLGDSLDKVISVYGDGYTQDVDSYNYVSGGVKLMFIVTDNAVSSITYAVA